MTTQAGRDRIAWLIVPFLIVFGFGWMIFDSIQTKVELNHVQEGAAQREAAITSLAQSVDLLRAQLEAAGEDPVVPPADDIVDTPLPPTIIRETVPEAVLAAMVRDALEQLTDDAPDVDALVAEAVAAYCAEDACKGADGTSVSVDDVAPIVVQAVADYCGTGACQGPAGPQGEQGPAGPACDDCVTEDEARAIALTVVQQWAVGTPVYCPRWPDDNEQQVITCWIGNWP